MEVDINNVATAPLFLMDFPKKKRKKEFFMTGVSVVVSLPLSRRSALRPPRLPSLHASYPRYFVHGTRGGHHFKRLSLYSTPTLPPPVTPMARDVKEARLLCGVPVTLRGS